MAGCLEVAGRHELARKLSAMIGEAVLRGAALANYSRASAAQGVNATLEAFLQQEDVVAHLFYRAFSEFIRGLYDSPGTGRVTKQLEVSLQPGPRARRSGQVRRRRRGRGPRRRPA